MKRLFDPAAAPFAVPVSKFRCFSLLEGRDEGIGMQQQHQEKELEKSGIGKRKKFAVAAAVLTVNLGILDCSICFHPLHPPIFQ
ncbi:hypothetical protein ZWY2020_031521 [Hordeum vulgare]|nr:hypothetical protein ZWY2020_031521 [Hordeum vulgare]